MKILSKPLIALVLVLNSAWPVTAAVFETKQARNIHEDNYRPCTFFALEGVDAWFGVPRTHPAYAQLFAILLTARAGKLSIRVETDGSDACGTAGVKTIWLE